MYLDYFGFKEFPFGLDIQVTPAQFSWTRKKIIKTIAEAPDHNHPLIAVFGQFGSGKTTILHGFPDYLSGNFDLIKITSKLQNAYQFVRILSRKLGIMGYDIPMERQIDLLFNEIKKRIRAGRKILLAIDDAHQAAKSVFQIIYLLLGINKEFRKSFFVVLLGEEVLEEKMKRENHFHLWDKALLKIWLHNLNPEEMKWFINTRLSSVMAGEKGRRFFTPEALQKIYDYSQGLPRKIQILCNNAMLFTYLKNEQIVSAETIEQVKNDDVCMAEIKKLLHPESAEKDVSEEPAASEEKPPESIEKATEAPETEGGVPSRQTLASLYRSYSHELMNDLQRSVTNMRLKSENKTLQVIGVAGPEAGQGVTEIVVHLALLEADRSAFSGNGIECFPSPTKILIVDGNNRHPELHTRCGIKIGPGIVDLLAGRGSISAAVQLVEGSNLAVLPFGGNYSRLHSHLPRKRFERLINRLRAMYDLILIDLPPILSEAGSADLCAVCDGVNFVVRSQACKAEVIDEAVRVLNASGAYILGGILNRRKFYIPGWIYKRL